MVTKEHLNRSLRKMAFYIGRWRQDPLAFVIEAMQADKYGYPTHQQAEVLKALPFHRYIAIKSGHGVGKTRLESWIHWWHLVCNKDLSQPMKCLLTGPTKQTVADRLWGECKLTRGHLVPWLRDQFIVNEERGVYNDATFHPWESTHQTASKENTEALAGVHGTPLFIIEEPSGVEEIVFETLGGGMSDEDARSVMFGNPTRNHGYFYNAFSSRESVWRCFTFSCRECLATEAYSYAYTDPLGREKVIQVKGRVTPMYITERERDHGQDSNVVRVRVDGEFPTEAKDQLISRADVMRCFERSMPESQPQMAIMGVDVADQGDDYSAYAVRQGRALIAVDRWHKPTDETETHITNTYREFVSHGVKIGRINIEKNGVGTGVFNNIRKALIDEPVIVAAVIPHEAPWRDGGVRCSRVRDYLWWQTRLWLKFSEPVFKDDGDLFQRLIHELTILTYDDADGPLKVEGKKSLRRRGESSPDMADAVTFTFHGADSQRLSAEPEAVIDRWRVIRNRRKKQQQDARKWVGA
jgi:hypothetical protein